tara:strand:+ start:245 stop:454 length:210 start_codon:yes stop_codon:yes gene_type:complete
MIEMDNEIDKLYREKYDMINKLKKIEEKIKVLEKERIASCNHKWVTEREQGIYGNKFTYCEHCKVNRIW